MNNEIQLQLVTEIEKSTIENQTKELIKTKFLPIIEQLDGWEQKAMEIVVTDISQKDLMKKAREGRLIVKNVRVSADKLRKELKQDSQAYLNTVQLVYNVIEAKTKSIEEHLESQEKFEELEKMRIDAELNQIRTSALQGYEQFVPFVLRSQLASLSEEEFNQLLQSAKHLKEANEMEIQKAKEEAELVAKQQAEERTRQLAEMERLMEEKRVMEAELKAEKERMEEKFRLEREENERISLELKKKQEEEFKAEKERIKAEKKLKNAPDKVKLAKLVTDLKQFNFPQMQSEDGEVILKNVQELFSKIIIFAEDKINNL